MSFNCNSAHSMYAMCLKKKRFSSYSKAIKIAEEMTLKYGKQTRVYYCPLCGKYHLTTKPLNETTNKTLDKKIKVC